MITTRVKTESKPVEQLNDAADGQIELNPVAPPYQHVRPYVRASTE